MNLIMNNFKEKYSAMQISEYIINKCVVDDFPISNLQLQRILYYIQKEFLEIGTICFDDDFKAFQFSPVIEEVYYYYCGFGIMPITIKYDINISKEYKSIINPIIEKVRKMNPWYFVNDVCASGKAWDLVYNGGDGLKDIISKELIYLYG